MILIIQICKEKFHYYEFVRPIEEIIKKTNTEFISTHYNDLNQDMLSKSEKIIICGTSLRDNSFLDDIEEFLWLKKYDKPVLGICGGMHIMGLVYNGNLHKKQEIGLTKIEFKKDFFGMKGSEEVYELHNFYVLSKECYVIAESKNCPQAVEYKERPFYAVLFHPEVRNREIIRNFILH